MIDNRPLSEIAAELPDDDLEFMDTLSDIAQTMGEDKVNIILAYFKNKTEVKEHE